MDLVIYIICILYLLGNEPDANPDTFIEMSINVYCAYKQTNMSTGYSFCTFTHDRFSFELMCAMESTSRHTYSLTAWTEHAGMCMCL